MEHSGRCGRACSEARAFFAMARAHASLLTAPIRAAVAVAYDTTAAVAWQGQPQSTTFDYTNEAMARARVAPTGESGTAGL